MKYELWLNLYPDGVYTGPYASRDVADNYAKRARIECRKIEWETKEPVRVADYLVPLEFIGVYIKQTHPIGQQPEGAVMVPGSEREASE
jgi:hypothetical protein